MVLQLVGPSVREFFAGESGCQVLETLGGGHEIVRVRVLDGDPSDEPAGLIARTFAQRQAFVDALEAGTELPQNPDAMLPIIRRFRVEEARAGRSASVEVEDYPLSHVSSHAGAQLQPVLELVWLMRVGVALEEDRERRNTDPGLATSALSMPAADLGREDR
jgi:ATP-dependent Clp protease ATP-binding subunit ClpA/ATP-dependent Clp protease ATP-binding subunit ClpC